MRRLTYPALGLGTLNALVFAAVILRGDLADLFWSAPHVIAALWALSVLGAHLALFGIDLRKGGARDAMRMIARGTLAGALVGAGVAGAAFLLLPIALLYGAALGLAAGFVFAVLDVALLAMVRAAGPRRA